jgi:hypothetical protein
MMNFDDLKYEVQRIDGSAESVITAIKLIVEAYQHRDHIPKSVEYGFFEEYYKQLIEWIDQGEDQKVEYAFKAIQEIIGQDSEFISPFAGASSKRRFGAQLNFISDLMETYLRSDLQVKDEHLLWGRKAADKRLRQLLHYLLGREGYVSATDIANSGVYVSTEKSQDARKKMADRDLQELADLGFVKRRVISARKIVYQVSNRTFYLRGRLEEEFGPNSGRTEFFVHKFEDQNPDNEIQGAEYLRMKKSEPELKQA